MGLVESEEILKKKKKIAKALQRRKSKENIFVWKMFERILKTCKT